MTVRSPRKALTSDVHDISSLASLRNRSFASKGGSVRTITTFSLSDRSVSKSCPESPPHVDEIANSLIDSSYGSDALQALTGQKRPSFGSHESESKKISRMALVGMITEVMMMSSAAEDEDDDGDNKHEMVRIDDVMKNRKFVEIRTLLEQGKSIARREREQKALGLRRRASMNDAYKNYTAKQQLSTVPPSIPRRSAEKPQYSSDDSTNISEASSKEMLPIENAIPPPPLSDTSRDLTSTDPDRDWSPRMPSRKRSLCKVVEPLKAVKEYAEESPTNEVSFTEESLHRTLLPTGGTIGLSPTGVEIARSPSGKKPLACSMASSASESVSLDSTPLTAQEIETYVMSRIPNFVKKQFPSDSWKKIFSAAAESQRSSTIASNTSSQMESAADSVSTASEWNEEVKSQESVDVSMITLDEVTSVVSGVTTPAVVVKAVNHNTNRSPHDAVINLGAAPADLNTTVRTSRSWHEGGDASAPRVPIRVPAARLSSEPTSPVESKLEDLPARFRASDSFIHTSSRRRVGFKHVHVRFYERVLDINPSTSSGPSVGLGWSYQEGAPIHLDQIPDSSTDPHSMLLKRDVRERIVRDLGYSTSDIARAVRKSLKIKNQRKQTYNNLRHERVEYLIEKSRRKVGRLLGFGTSQSGQLQRKSSIPPKASRSK